MKETVKINLAQRLFDLDSDAYARLKSYLDSLSKYFNDTLGEAEEIISDIEQRMAELLLEKLGDKKQVVTLDDIETIIKLMGTAEDFARETDMDDGQAEKEPENKQSTTGNYSKTHRRLFRDPDNTIIGGVASGIAAYFNVDIIWIRLAFVALFFVNGIGLISYLILWVVVPVARSRAQRLQMRGRPVNIENIQESVKDEFSKVKDNFSKFSQSESYRQTRDTAHDVFKVIGTIILAFFKVILVIVAIALAIAALGIIISIIATFAAGSFWSGWHFPNLQMHESLIPFFQSMSLFGIAFLLVIIIPIGVIITAFVRLAFGIKGKTTILSAFTWTFWSLALVYVLITLFTGRGGIDFGQKITEDTTIELPTKQVLYVRLNEQNLSMGRKNHYSILGKDIVRDKWHNAFYLEPELEIRKAFGDEMELNIEYSSFIPWNSNFNRIPYIWSFRDSVLIIDNYWEIDEDEMWRLPKVKVILSVPEGQYIHFDRDFQAIPSLEEDGNEWPHWYYNRELVMRENGMERMKKTD